MEVVRKMLPEGLEREAVADRFLMLRLKKKHGERWGIIFRQCAKELFEIEDIIAGSPSSASKLRVRDLLCSVNGARITSTQQVAKVFQNDTVDMVVFRPSEVPNLLRLQDLMLSLDNTDQRKLKRQRNNDEGVEETPDVEIVGVATRSRCKKAEDMPHARSCCSKLPFVPCHFVLKNNVDGAQYVVTRMSNVQHCAQCYCSLCQVPASDCSQWSWHCQIALHIDEKRAFDFLCNKLSPHYPAVEVIE